MRVPSMDEFRSFFMLSHLAFQPGGGASAFIVVRPEEEYRRELWVRQAGHAPRKLAEMGSGLFDWEDSSTLLFAAPKEPGARVSPFCRVTLEGLVTDGFELPGAVEKLLPLGEGRYLALAVLEEEEGPEPEEIRMIDRLPWWENGEGFLGEKRRCLCLYQEGEADLVPISGEQEEVERFCLSPRGDRVAYCAKKRDGLLPQKDVVVEYELATGGRRTLLEEEYLISHLAYWQDDLILAGTDMKQYGWNENPCLYRLETGSGKIAPLAAPDLSIGGRVNTDCRHGGGIVYKVWEDTLWFTALEGYQSGLYRLELPSGALEAVETELEAVECFDVGSQGVQMIAFRGQELQEVYRLEEQGHLKLSDFHGEVLADLWRGKPIHHTLERDGFVIDGWVMLPPDYREENRYPAILNIHGGPKTAYGEIYFHEMQYWAGQGYIVLWCNPRGSDGKGDAFADIRGRYGEGDYRDLMAFLDRMLRRHPAIDSHRVGVTGGSYGGFMVNWIIGHTQRFAAAVSQRCISNWISFAGTSDIGYLFTLDQQGTDCWEGQNRLWRKSPLKYADRARTPTLFIHSDEDYRCWLPESYQMFTALKLQEVETKICLFHGENHDLSRTGRPGNRRRRLEEITAWMDHYLKGDGK